MPQMGPLLWLNLFFFFILGYALFLTLNYFCMPPVKIKMLEFRTGSQEKSWKW
uniref:ATP synthase complex subunit 8 n=1 Tax=Cherax setosus TaxID=99754 RepID=A0A8F7GK14_9EUCA|nr:ATP synthase F0 subunit 8 [Cherax setosus]